MRLPWKRVNLARASCAFSCTTVLFGMIAMFSSHWVVIQDQIHVGLVSACYGPTCTSTMENIPKDYRAPAVFLLILMFFMPLIMMFAAAILQAITVIKGPQKHRDMSALILVWLSGYHGILTVLIGITVNALVPSDRNTNVITPSPYRMPGTTTNAPYFGQGDFDTGMVKGPSEYTHYADYNDGGNGASPFLFGGSAKIGWSAYVGLISVLLSLVSAVLASLYYGKSENEDTEDTIPLQPNTV